MVITELHSGITDDLNCIVFLNDSTGYACGGTRYESGRILKTIDRGFTWQNQSSADMSKALYKIVFPSSDTGFCCGYDGKIFRTFNGGSDWDPYQTGRWFPLRDIFMLNSVKGFSCGGDGYQLGYKVSTASSGNLWTGDTSKMEYRSIHFFNESAGVLAGYGAILSTSNGGETWSYTNADQDFFVSMDFVNDRIGYAVGYTGSILKTSDGGKTWERLRNANSLFVPQKLFNRVAFRNEHIGYIAGDNGCFLKTVDGGSHWQEVDNAPGDDWKGISLTGDGGFVCGTGGKIFHFLDQ